MTKVSVAPFNFLLEERKFLIQFLLLPFTLPSADVWRRDSSAISHVGEREHKSVDCIRVLPSLDVMSKRPVFGASLRSVSGCMRWGSSEIHLEKQDSYFN